MYDGDWDGWGLCDLHSDMPFGKHKGMKMSWIVENDPGYIIWLSRNAENFEMSNAVLKAAIDSRKEFK